MIHIKSFSHGALILFLALLFAMPAIPIQVDGQHPVSQDAVYDTIFVYDTIWTHETIYDTVWVYDTIYIEETIDRIEKFAPFDADRVSYQALQPVQLVPMSMKTELAPLLITTSFAQPVKQSPLKRSKPKIASYKGNSHQRLTLNPTKGKFDPSVFREGTFSLEGYAGPVFQQTQYAFVADDDRNPDLEHASSPTTGLQYGLRLNYHLYQMTLQTGVGMSQLSENLKYTSIRNRVDSTQQSLTKFHWVELTDSVKVLNVDSLLRGDTVWVTYVYPYDSLMGYDSIYYRYDSIRIEDAYKERVTHYLLEVPLVFSWQWNLSRAAIALKAGGINQIHLFSTGKAFSGYGTVDAIESVTHFTKYNFALYGGLACSYQVTSDFDVGIEAFYKYPLRKFAESFNASLTKQTSGVVFSFCYHFNPKKR
jgi:hypothetical protein